MWTHFIWLGSPYHTESVCLPMFVGGTAVSPVDAVFNLGVTFDAQLTTLNHVDNVVRSCFFHIRQLRSVRRSLTGDALRTLVHAFIACRVDYCNTLLYGVADGVHRRLQSVLHRAAAPLITAIRRSPRTDNSLQQPQLPHPQLGTVFPRSLVVRAPGSSSNAA